MQVKRIIPCLDVNDGRVVKGVKFKDIKDAGDPVEFARRYNAGGADELAFLDIGATVNSRKTLLEVVRRIAAEISIPLCVGGGIRTVEDMREAMDAGASKVSVCSSALKRPELLSEMAKAFGSQSVMLAIDAARAADDIDGKKIWHAFSNGGGIDSGRDAIEWAILAAELGAGEIMVNSIDLDGTGEGYDLDLTNAISEAVTVPVIASGGAGSLEQIAQVLLNTKADAALVASLLHFGKTSIPEIKKYLADKGVSVK